MICSFSESSARPDSLSSLRKASSCPSSSCLLWECSPRPPVSTACAGAAGCEAVNLPSDAKEAALSPAPTTDPSPTPRVTSVRPSCMRRAARPAKAPPTMPTTTPAPAPLATEPTKARKGFARAASIAACGGREDPHESWSPHYATSCSHPGADRCATRDWCSLPPQRKHRRHPGG